MKKLTRILTMGGFGLLAALATGAGSAHAATASVTPENKPAVNQAADWGHGDQTVGFYRSLQDCELAGQFGERVGDWDDHDCSPVGLGLRRGSWALEVASDDDWDRLGFGVPFGAVHGFPNQFRPAWPGDFRPGHHGPAIGHHGPVIRHNGPVIRHNGPGNRHDDPVIHHNDPVGNSPHGPAPHQHH